MWNSQSNVVVDVDLDDLSIYRDLIDAILRQD